MTLTVAQGDHVVAHWTPTGTHDGPLISPAGKRCHPTHKKVTTVGRSTFEIRNGKLVRGWTFWDMAGFLMQLGLMPPM